MPQLQSLLHAFLASTPTLPSSSLSTLAYRHAKLAISGSVYAFTGPSKSVLDNWSPCAIQVGEFTFHTSEHVIFAVAKAGYFHDHRTLAAALACPPDIDPKTSKAIGRRVQGFNPHEWADASLWISDVVLLLKALQNPRVAHELLATGDRIICEASRTDKIWGVGMDAQHRDILRPSTWKGSNELGKSLMRVREYLKQGVRQGRFEGDGITSQDNMDLFYSWFEGADDAHAQRQPRLVAVK